MSHHETRRFVDHHVIEVDLDPVTEMNVRHHERNLTLDHVQAVAHECRSLWGSYIDPDRFFRRLAELRPSRPFDE